LFPGYGRVRTTKSVGTKSLGKGGCRPTIESPMPAASSLRTSNTYVGAQFRRLRTKLGAPVAIKAMAARLARLVYRMATLRHKEHQFDALIEGWKNGRHLLIEAKTASAGPADAHRFVKQLGSSSIIALHTLRSSRRSTLRSCCCLSQHATCDPC
jgi:hypothetical protein